jgi:hypothetical protein
MHPQGHLRLFAISPEVPFADQNPEQESRREIT